MKTLTTEKTIQEFCESGLGAEACISWLDDIWDAVNEAEYEWGERTENHPFSALMHAIYHDLKAAAYEIEQEAERQARLARAKKALSEGADAK